MASARVIKIALRMAADTKALVTVGGDGRGEWFIGNVTSMRDNIVDFELAPVHRNPLTRYVMLDADRITFVGFNRIA